MDNAEPTSGGGSEKPPEASPEASPGVIRTSVGVEKHEVTIDYDPSVITEASLREVVTRLAPEHDGHFDKCLMRLEGRACEACALHLERKAEAIPGVVRARATFIGGTMAVTYDDALLTPEQVVEKVHATGAPVRPVSTEEPEGWLRTERIEAAAMIFCLLFAIAGWAAGTGTALSTFCYVLAYGCGGVFGLRACIQSLKEWTIDVDLLMVLAALGAAYVGAPFEGATLLFLFSLSNVLQEYAIDRTRKAINSLMKLRPEKALTRRGGHTVCLPVGELVIGDIVLVRPGEAIPLDSEIVEGSSAVDQSSVTGESMPVHKQAGDTVFAGTLNQSGGIEIRVLKLAKDSTIEKLIRMVEEAQSEKAETQRFLDRAEQWYSCGVIAFTLSLIFGPSALPHLFPGFIEHLPFDQIFYRAMTVMVVASPCALIISTPASILSAIGGAARRGVLFKGGAYLERAATVEVVAFDKTGTLTEGKPHITDTIVDGVAARFGPTPEVGALGLLMLAAAVEAKSEHPLACAIVDEAERRGLELPNCTDFQSVSGHGAHGVVNGRAIVVGSPRYFQDLSIPCEPTVRAMETLQSEGKTCVLVGELDAAGSGVILGALAVADILRESASRVVAHLKELGIKRVVMLTGDNHLVAAAIGAQAGVDAVYAELLPEDKVRVIKELKQIGPVAMIGDGVNDAPALALSDIGIAMGAAGTDVAMETADVVLMSNDLHNVPFAISVARQARRVIWQNLTFSLAVIVVLMISALGFSLRLPLGVIGHEGSTVLVCLNGLRLLAFRGRL